VSLGVGTLALVGTGTFAGLTGQVPVNAKVTSGTFMLSAVPGTPQVTEGNGQSLPAGTLTLSNFKTTVNGQGTTLQYTLTNADPGHTYTIPFTVYDTGSLPGLVTSIKYTPGGTTSLAHNLTISVCFMKGSTCKTIGGPNQAPKYTSMTGANTAVFDTTNTSNNTYGDGLTNFLGSNPTESASSKYGFGVSQTYEIVEHYNSTGTNLTEGEGMTTTQTFTVMGHND